MSPASWAQMAALLVLLAISTPLLGGYMARIFTGEGAPGDRCFLPLERATYRLLRIDPRSEQRWTAYVGSALALAMVGALLTYALLLGQRALPLNPDSRRGLSPGLAFNTAISFVTSTDWQNYAGESSLSQFSQMVALVVHQFLATAMGMGLCVAFIRALTRRRTTTLGNFWVDAVRSSVRVLLPVSIAFAIALLAGGAMQNFHGVRTVPTVAAVGTHTAGAATMHQQIPGGPVASMTAIEMAGANGGGYFGANLAQPYANPSPVTNLLEIWLSVMIPFAFAWTFGRMIGSMRQAAVVLVAMSLLFSLALVGDTVLETRGNAKLAQAGVSQTASTANPGGNLEGKDLRFGAAGSALNAVAVTSTSTGGANSALESYTPLGGAIPLFDIMLGEVSPGGTGTGLYGMLIFVLITVFIAGLMVGRTPMYLGKRILATDMTLAAIYILVLPVTVLVLAGVSLLVPHAASRISATGPHSITEIVYAYASAANNNGSAFAGLSGNTGWFNSTLALAMWVGRFFEIIAALALAGSLGRKRTYAVTAGTLRTDTPLFTGLLIAVAIILVGLTYFPVLALGPLAEQFAGHFGV